MPLTIIQECPGRDVPRLERRMGAKYTLRKILVIIRLGTCSYDSMVVSCPPQSPLLRCAGVGVLDSIGEASEWIELTSCVALETARKQAN